LATADSLRFCGSAGRIAEEVRIIEKLGVGYFVIIHCEVEVQRTK
jgi:hypothetical protein